LHLPSQSQHLESTQSHLVRLGVNSLCVHTSLHYQFDPFQNETGSKPLNEVHYFNLV